MKFANPNWLWGILVLPVAYLLMLYLDRRGRATFSKFVGRKLWKTIIPEMSWSFRTRKSKVFLVAFAFLLLALARPQFGTHEETVQVSGLDIVLVLDVSSSMDAEDVVPSRILKAKHLIRSFVSQLGGDRVGVVAFANSSYLASPLTTDLDYLLETVQILSPKAIQSQGTDIGTALATALRALDRGAEVSTPGRTGSLASRVILLISDGEDHEDAAEKQAAQIKKMGAKLYVVGVGTESGGPIPVKSTDGRQSQGFKKDRVGKTIVTTFNPSFLSRLAALGDGKYWNATAGEGEVQDLLHELGALDRTDLTERKFLVFEDRFQIPLFIAILLFFLELALPTRKVANKATKLFFLLGMSSALWSKPVLADDLFKKPTSLDSYFNNKKGLEAYQQGRLEDAQNDFGAAQARDPNSPVLEFNQGVVQLEKGEVDRAIEAFKHSAKGALNKGDHNLSGKSLYNLGNAFTKKQDIRSAAKSYLGAIQEAIEAKNPTLEAEARKNLQLLVEEVKKQKLKQENKGKPQKDQQDQKDQQKDPKQSSDQQQNQDFSKDTKSEQGKDQEKDKESKSKQGQKSKKDSDKNSDQDSDQDSEKKDSDSKDGSQGDQGDEEKNKSSEEQKSQESKESQESKNPQDGDQKATQEKGKRQFKSKKMDKQDADRVLSELMSRERELQDRLNNQDAKTQNSPRDW